MGSQLSAVNKALPPPLPGMSSSNSNMGQAGIAPLVRMMTLSPCHSQRMKKDHAHRHWPQTAGVGAESGAPPKCSSEQNLLRLLRDPDLMLKNNVKASVNKLVFWVCFFLN